MGCLMSPTHKDAVLGQSGMPVSDHGFNSYLEPKEPKEFWHWTWDVSEGLTFSTTMVCWYRL